MSKVIELKKQLQQALDVEKPQKIAEIKALMRDYEITPEDLMDPTTRGRRGKRGRKATGLTPSSDALLRVERDGQLIAEYVGGKRGRLPDAILELLQGGLREVKKAMTPAGQEFFATESGKQTLETLIARAKKLSQS